MSHLRNNPGSKARRLNPSAAGLCLGLLCAEALLAHSVQLSREELVQDSSDIVVGRVVSAAARWNDLHTLIVTDYKVKVEERLKGEGNAEVTVTMPGGTLNGETHQTCLSFALEAGHRYLLFLDQPGLPSLSPITGAGQGAYREVPEAGGASAQAAANVAPFSSNGASASFAELVRTVRSEVRAAAAAPASTRRNLRIENDLPAKIYRPLAKGLDAATSGTRVESPALSPETVRPERHQTATLERASFDLLEPLEHRGSEAYVYSMSPPAPIVFNPLPLEWGWSPHDQYMMSRWNAYAGELFRVMQPTGDWAFGNNRFDMTGWPSSDTMMAQFGAGWGPTTLGVTYTRWYGNGPIIEADISLNPAYGWTLDNEYGARDDSGDWSFEQTVLHELGHAFGLNHPWETQNVWWDSVMNYSPKWARVPELFADDTNAVRNAYPGVAIHDGLLSAYGTGDSGNNNATYEAMTLVSRTVHQGESVAFNTGFKMENCGTDVIRNPQVEVYLCPRRMSWDNAIYLTTLDYSGNELPSFFTLYAGAPAIGIPSWVTPGEYHIGLFLRDDADSAQYNNGAWLNHDQSLTVKAACFDDAFEPNDSINSPALIYASWQGVVYTGLSACASNSDFYSVFLYRGEELAVFLGYSTSESQVALYVFDPDRYSNHEIVYGPGSVTLPVTKTGYWTIQVAPQADMVNRYDLGLLLSGPGGSGCATSDSEYDCNGNGILDACDLREGQSQDSNADGIPDECHGARFHRGDSNDDGRLGISDAIFLLEFLFTGSRTLKCSESADVDNDGKLTIGDAIYLLGFSFLGGPPPANPGPPGSDCGLDPDPAGSSKDLGCSSYTSCSDS